MKSAGIPSQIMSYPQEVRIEKLTGLATVDLQCFEMNPTTLINTLRAPLSNWDSNPDRLVSTSGQRNVPDELLRIYDNMNA
ncbi:unnamed protein product [Sphenostylis stenocarpa]|uniref:Uncharacterized protein n=1 Tax=Sphenostylis stenocarpa TaxID=92480 RepID=A0AA86SEL9_9FABA|nr:unnamed protein product [Sphenostylis stenocarpa]